MLLAVVRGTGPAVARAMEVLDDPDREFAASVFTRLEVLPKAIYHRKTGEARFYEAFFNGVTCWADDYPVIVESAYQEARACGLAAMDALHVAAAASVGADELVTTERPEKPLHRTSRVRVISIHPG